MNGRLVVLALPFLLHGACVVYENKGNDVAPGCGPRGQAPDGAACHCASDCATHQAGTICLEEEVTGVPTGACAHLCSVDEDCEPGYACSAGMCALLCASSADCGRGRFCDTSLTGGATVCNFLCDEDSDCDSGRCNLYSNQCIQEHAELHGAGVDAACRTNGDCLSTSCIDGICTTRCDAAVEHCPDNAICVSLGLCMPPCTTDRDCGAVGASASCIEIDGEHACF